MPKLTHLDKKGQALMVDVGQKIETKRVAVARGRIFVSSPTLDLIQEDSIPKGDVFAAARIAGIMATKKTADLIPLCHPLMLTGSKIDFKIDTQKNAIEVEATVRTTGKTGVEMEALTAASVALLTIFDMCKAVDKKMIISDIRLIYKSGGKSGDFTRKGEELWEEL